MGINRIDQNNSIHFLPATTPPVAHESDARTIPQPPQKGLSITEAAGRGSISLNNYSVSRHPSTPLNDLSIFDSNKTSKILQAKTAGEARKTVPVLQRAFEWIYTFFNKTYTTKADAAAAFYTAVKDKSPQEAYTSLRQLLDPKERHRVQLEISTGRADDFQLKLKVGNLEIAQSQKMPLHAPERKEVEGILRAIKLSDTLIQKGAPVDVEAGLLTASSKFHTAQITGDIESFMDVRSAMDLEHQDLFSIETMTDTTGRLSYSLKIGGESIYSSPSILSSALTIEEQEQLSKLDQLDTNQAKAISHKLENARLTAQVAQELYPIVANQMDMKKADPNHKSSYTSRYPTQERYELALAKALDGKSALLEKYGAIIRFVASTSKRNNQQDSFPLSIKRNSTDNVYELEVKKTVLQTPGKMATTSSYTQNKLIPQSAFKVDHEEQRNSVNVTAVNLAMIEEIGRVRFSQAATDSSNKALANDLPRATYALKGRRVKGFRSDGDNASPADKNSLNNQFNLDHFRKNIIARLNCSPKQQLALETLSYQNLQGIVQSSSLSSYGGGVDIEDMNELFMQGFPADVSYNFKAKGDEITLVARTQWKLQGRNLPDVKTIKEPVISIQMKINRNGYVTIDHINAYATKR